MKQSILFLPIFLFPILISAVSGCAIKTTSPKTRTVEITSIREEVKEDSRKIMTEAELQSQVMSFADRFASRILQGYEDFDELSPPFEQRRIIERNAVYSVTAAFTIAAESEPDVALLDMVVMVTLGHSIYEEYWLPKLGAPIASMERALRKSEDDIWKIAAKLLQPDQQAELLAIIQEWRQNNPEDLAFSYVRFHDFAGKRRQSSLSRSGDPNGLLQSVEIATKQVEDVKLLAERGMFLATRMPLLTGFFLDTSLSQVFTNPGVQDTLTSLHTLSEASERMVGVAEQLPFMVAREREASINQAMDRLAEERKKTIEEFLAEETRLKGILSLLKETLMEGSNLVVATNSLTKQLNLGASPESSEPFDINDYKETLREATGTVTQLNSLVGEANRLLNSPGWENLLPQLENTIGRVGEESDKVIDHTFVRGIFLLLIWLVGYLLARFALYYFTTKRSSGS
jgi:hypothetical protein